jgi:hypothetical protein
MWNLVRGHYWRVVPLIFVGIVYGVGWMFTNVDAYRLMMCPAVPRFAPEYCGIDIGQPALAAVSFLFYTAIAMLLARSFVWRFWRLFAGIFIATSIYMVSSVPAVEMWGQERNIDATVLAALLFGVTTAWIVVDYVMFYLKLRRKG